MVEYKLYSDSYIKVILCEVVVNILDLDFKSFLTVATGISLESKHGSKRQGITYFTGDSRRRRGAAGPRRDGSTILMSFHGNGMSYGLGSYRFRHIGHEPIHCKAS